MRFQLRVIFICINNSASDSLKSFADIVWIFKNFFAGTHRRQRFLHASNATNRYQFDTPIRPPHSRICSTCHMRFLKSAFGSLRLNTARGRRFLFRQSWFFYVTATITLMLLFFRARIINWPHASYQSHAARDRGRTQVDVKYRAPLV